MFNKDSLYSDNILLSDEVFALIRDLIKDYCGIFFDENSKYLLEGRLSRRLKSLYITDFRDYYRFLLYDRKREEELTAIIDLLTVNETYFFREQNQLTAFSKEILPELRDKNRQKKRLRIWSAGCSTGEEPYTIAMLILESGLMQGWEINILGSDINQRVLTAARRGAYRMNSFRTTDNYYIKKYFGETDGLHLVKDDLKNLVSFSYTNLLDPVRIRLIEQMDVIFCRNVMIYFNIDTRRKVIDNFYDRLVPGGYMLLGHAESLMNISAAFSLRHLKYDMVYQKPDLQERDR